MTSRPRITRLNNIGLKLLALCIGYSLWYIFSQPQIISVTVSAPLCFDTTATTRTINAPESIAVTLAGTRQALASLDLNALAIHINTDKLASSEHTIPLQKKNLFLPQQINLIHYEPAPLVITINDQPVSNQEQQGVPV